MKSKILFLSLALAIVVAGIIFSSAAVSSLSHVPQDPNKEPPKLIEGVTIVAGTSSLVSEIKQPGLPVRLKIPAISVDAALEYVGLTSDGAMAVPEGPVHAAWLDLGPRPGDEGTAIIDGHEGWKDDIQAVFDNLHKLQIGDKIYVDDKQGATVTFVVRALQTYGQGEKVPDVFISHDGKSHLNLITCAGTWNAAEKSYSSRLVVFADKEIK